jgi:hypothetical protein
MLQSNYFIDTLVTNVNNVEINNVEIKYLEIIILH